MAARSLAVGQEVAGTQLAVELAVSESGKLPHLCGDDDCVITAICGSWKNRCLLAFAPCFDKLTSHVAGYLQWFGDGRSLSDKAGQFNRRRKVNALRQFFDLNLDCQLHGLDPTI